MSKTDRKVDIPGRHQEDRFITLTALRKRRLICRHGLQDVGIQISDQKVRNRLHTDNLQAHKATRKPAMTALHLQACLHRCRQHRQSNVGECHVHVMCPGSVFGNWMKHGDDVENDMLIVAEIEFGGFWWGQSHGVRRYLHHWQKKACHH